MKIVLINHSDVRGGASVVTYRLMKALRGIGHDARMLVVHKATDDPNVVKGGPAWLQKGAFIVEELDILAACGGRKENIFKLSCGTAGLALSKHPLIEEADCVILNWVNQGMLALSEIGAIASKKPTLWTMHDMWNLTALCHHAGDCQQYKEEKGCRECPMTRWGYLGRNTWRRKRTLYDGTAIQFVAVSSWLSKLCVESGLMRNQKVACIPNAFPVEEFYTEPRKSRAEMGLPEGKKIIAMGAARLDDPIKGLDYAIEALNGLTAEDALAVFFGTIRDENALKNLKFPYLCLGSLDTEAVRELLAHASVVMSTSLYETLPGTLVEGMAAGCTPVSFDRGGQGDIMLPEAADFLVKAYDTKAFTAALERALRTPLPPEALREAVERKFSSEAVARQYADLINDTINNNK